MVNMRQQDVLELFRNEAESLGNVENSQSEIINKLAQLLADCGGQLSKENFDDLVHIGAVMYKEGLGKHRARSEVAATLRESLEQRNKPT
jgi:hypothetical protein